MGFILWQSKTIILNIFLLGSVTLVRSKTNRRELSRHFILEPELLARYDRTTAWNGAPREETEELKWQNGMYDHGKDTRERYKEIRQEPGFRIIEKGRISDRSKNFQNDFRELRIINNREETGSDIERLVNNRESNFNVKRERHDREDRHDKRDEYMRTVNRHSHRQQQRIPTDARQERRMPSNERERQFQYDRRHDGQHIESRFDKRRIYPFMETELIEVKRGERIGNQQRLHIENKQGRSGIDRNVNQKKRFEFKNNVRDLESRLPIHTPQEDETRAFEDRLNEARFTGNRPSERLSHEAKHVEYRFDNIDDRKYDRYIRNYVREVQFNDRAMGYRFSELRNQRLERSIRDGIPSEARFVDHRREDREEKNTRSLIQFNERKEQEEINRIVKDQRNQQEARTENRHQNQKAFEITERTPKNVQELQMNRRHSYQQQLIRQEGLQDIYEVRNDNRHFKDQAKIVEARLLRKETDDDRRDIHRYEDRSIDGKAENRRSRLHVEISKNTLQTYGGNRQILHLHRPHFATRFDKGLIFYRGVDQTRVPFENRENMISAMNYYLYSIKRVLLTLAQGLLFAYLTAKIVTPELHAKNRVCEIVTKSTAATGF